MGENATVNTGEVTATQQAEARTFTQEELNAIVGKRLAEEKGKYADYDVLKAKADKFDEAEEASKSELQKATEKVNKLQAQIDSMTKADEVRRIRESVASASGVPAGLLNGETEEECQKQAEAILAFAKPSSYPAVKDAGEVTKTSGGKTRDQFEDWFNSAMQKN
jgi:hypothetical protein